MSSHILLSVLLVPGWALNNSVIEFLAPNRDEMVNFFFPHFTPFSDMMDLVLRASEFGFPSYLRRTQLLPDSFVFTIPDQLMLGTISQVEFHIPTFVRKLVELAKVKLGRKTGWESIPDETKRVWMASFQPQNVLELINPTALRMVIYDERSMVSSDYARAASMTAKIIPAYEYNSEPISNVPLSIVLMSGWRLLFWTSISQKPNFYFTVNHRDQVDSATTIKAPEKLDELSSTFIFHVCSEMRRDPELKPTDIPLGFCPNPCATSPCLTLAHTAGQKCHLMGRGMFMNDFSCECLPGYKWVSNAAAMTSNNRTEVNTPMSDEIGACVPIDICNNYCSNQGTLRCDLIPGTSTAVCLCKIAYMGPTCNTQRDPCIELSDKEKMPGNMACNTGQGGTCSPVMGSDYYECRCPSGFIKDASLDFDNCLALNDKCTSEVCVRGDCISSADGSNFICLCPEEAYGRHCENLRGNWAQWSPWSACSPACGNGKIRYRERVRGCLYGDACTGGRRRQVDVCSENLPCPDELVRLGMGPDALAPQDILHGGEAQPNFDLQQAYALKRRRYSLLTQVFKFLFLLICGFAIVSVTLMFAYAILYWTGQ